jgi:putative ABC transport system permease protein
MNTAEAVASAVRNLGSHKLRSGLTMLGMIFGVGAVIAMLSIGEGAERQAMGMIERLGLRNVLVRDREIKAEELSEVRTKSLGVSPRDAAAIAEAVPGVEAVLPRLAIDPYKIRSATGKTEASVFGVTADQADAAGLTLAEGRFLDALDERSHAQVCVLGASVRRDLFGFEAALGEHVKVNDVWLEVVGVLAPAGTGSGSFQGVSLGTPAEEIYIPVTTARRKFQQNPLAAPLDEVLVRLEEGAVPARAAAQIDELLSRLHAGERDYELVVPEALLEQSRRTQRLFNIVMGCIAGISLLVGGIGIMNIMLATVLERTREIGVRRAVGARQQDIRFQFVVESFTISLLGGAMGIMMGIAIARLVAAAAGWSTVVTIGAVVLSTGVAVAVGLLSGIYPAVRAARLDPIEALRYE